MQRRSQGGGNTSSARKTSSGEGSGLGRGAAGPVASVGRMQIPRPQCSWSHRVSQSDSSVRRSEPFPRGGGYSGAPWGLGASSVCSPQPSFQHKPDYVFFLQIKWANYNHGVSGVVEGSSGPLAKSPSFQPRSLRLSEAEALAPSPTRHTWGRHPSLGANRTGLPAPQGLVRLEKACAFPQEAAGALGRALGAPLGAPPPRRSSTSAPGPGVRAEHPGLSAPGEGF